MVRGLRRLYADLGVPDIDLRAQNLVLFIRAGRQEQEAMLYAILAEQQAR